MDGWEEGVPDGKPASSRALRLPPARLEQSGPGPVWRVGRERQVGQGAAGRHTSG